ncbi:MAG: hypothetical protein P9L94_17330 [Candidatus Hinthialibacter antarcticus]|nr:hypothetical protein [Candidatus Hinthialibacter antarcticus]
MVQQLFQSIRSDPDPVEMLEAAGYIFERDRGVLQSYLLNRPDLADFLKAAIELIYRRFDCPSPPFIEYSTGYEEDDEDYLVVNMPTKMSAKEAVEVLKEFDAEWQFKFYDKVMFRVRYFG